MLETLFNSILEDFLIPNKSFCKLILLFQFLFKRLMLLPILAPYGQFNNRCFIDLFDLTLQLMLGQPDIKIVSNLLNSIIKFDLWRIISLKIRVLHFYKKSLFFIFFDLVLQLLVGDQGHDVCSVDAQHLFVFYQAIYYDGTAVI